MTELEVLRTGYTATLRAVEELSPGDLARPTPCADWDVRALLVHVHAATDGLVEVLHGREGDWARDSLGDDPAAALRRSFDDALTAWAEPGAVDVASRQMPGMRVVDFAMVDAVAHAWDLCVALGRRFEIPDDQAALVHQRWAGEPAATGRQYGVFGPLVEVPDGDPVFDRLLGEVGRDPAQSAATT